MAQNVSPSDLSLSEFLTKLVTDASEAFLVAQQHQESYYGDLEAAAISAPAEFAKAIPEIEVDRELASLFPSADPARPSLVFVGAPYRPSQSGVVEDPPIQQTLGLRLAPAAGASSGSGLPDPGPVAKTTAPTKLPDPTLRLSQEQVQLIRDAARLQVSTRQQGYLQRVLSQPRLRLFIDKTRITAKVGLGARTVTGGPTAARTNPATSATATSVQNLLKGPSPLQLSVRMVDDKAPQTNGLAVDIYSEIELTLKSIVS